jgi:hypothetical protein
LADPTDVEWLKNQMTGSPKVWAKEYTSGHCTFLWAKNAPWMDDVMAILDGNVPEITKTE